MNSLEALREVTGQYSNACKCSYELVRQYLLALAVGFEQTSVSYCSRTGRVIS